MAKFLVTYVRMERQLGTIEVTAPSMADAEWEARRRARAYRKGYHNAGPEDWEVDVDGHKITVGGVKEVNG